MKYILLVYLFSPSGEFQLKDVVETSSYVECENTAAAYAKNMINTQNQMSFFCLTEDEYNRDSDKN